MPKLPEPPPADALARAAPDWTVLPARTILYRVYFQGGPYPSRWDALRTFGPTTARFDHHDPPPQPQARGVLYSAAQPTTALAEVFQTRRVIDAVGGAPWLVGFRLARPVRLLNLTGTWPTRAGASMVLSSGLRPRAQRWSRAIHAAYPEAEGLCYPSSMHAHAPAVVLYERARDALPAAPSLHRALSDPSIRVLLENAAFEVGYGLSLRSPP